MFVAVVYCKHNGTKSNRPDGDYSCFIADTKSGAIEKAMAAKTKWDGYTDHLGYKHIYSVLVGPLTSEVKPVYEEVYI